MTLRQAQASNAIGRIDRRKQTDSRGLDAMQWTTPTSQRLEAAGREQAEL